MTIELSSRTATLKVAGKDVGSHEFGSGFNGEVGLATQQSNPWFDDLKLTDAGGTVVLEDTFDTAKKGDRLTLKAGPCNLTIRSERAGIGIDNLILLRSKLEANVDAETRRYVRKVYCDCLGRGPTDLELLIASGKDRKAFVQSIARSLEFYQTWYDQELFYFLLLDNFRPSTPVLVAIPSRLQNGQISVRDALQEICISQYFNSRNPENDTFVTVVFEQLLRMKVQSHVELLEAGKKMYDRYDAKIFGVEGMNQSDVVKIAMRQQDFSMLYVRRLYRRMVGHEPPAEVLAAEVERFEKNPYGFGEMICEWLLSEVERAFARMKDVIGMRPIFRKKDERVKAHVFVAALASLIDRALEKALKTERLDVSSRESWQLLRSVRVVDIDLGNGQTKRSVTRGSKRVEPILRAIPIVDLDPPIRANGGCQPL